MAPLLGVQLVFFGGVYALTLTCALALALKLRASVRRLKRQPANNQNRSMKLALEQRIQLAIASTLQVTTIFEQKNSIAY